MLWEPGEGHLVGFLEASLEEEMTPGAHVGSSQVTRMAVILGSTAGPPRH